MNDILERLSRLSIEELEYVINAAQEQIKEKRRQEELERQRQAELERQRQERERLEAERKKQEEIAQLQKRLKELMGDDHQNIQQGKDPQNVQAGNSPQNAQQPSYSMVACPKCHKLATSDSRFCPNCGSDMIRRDMNGKAENSAPASMQCPYCHKSNPADSRFCLYCGRSLVNSGGGMGGGPSGAGQNGGAGQGSNSAGQSGSAAGQNSAGSSSAAPNNAGAGSVFINGAMKKWDSLAGEAEVLGWKEISVKAPENKPCGTIRITTKRILISTEGAMQRGFRNSGGLLVYAATSGMEKGKPWVMIPLEGVRSYSLNKKELQIQADKHFLLSGSKAKDVYAALQQVLPQQAR